jgi:hypothetical protein
LSRPHWAITYPGAVRAMDLSWLADRFRWEKLAGRYDALFLV